MVYDENDHAVYSGLERITGSLDGKSGSFVVQMTGKFDGSVATGDWTIVPGSGTGELKGLRGNRQLCRSTAHQQYPLDARLRL